MTENELSKIIIGCAIEDHKQLGPGILESAYQECLFYELKKAGLSIQNEKPMPIVYKLGLLLNFQVSILKNGVKRVIN